MPFGNFDELDRFNDRDYYDEDNQYHGPTNRGEIINTNYRNRVKEIKRQIMSKKTKNPKQQNFFKPTLIKCGKHLINPNDVSRISNIKVSVNQSDDVSNDEDWPNQHESSRVEKNLYIVKFISDPNPEYPCWVEKKDIGILLEQFNIVE